MILFGTVERVRRDQLVVRDRRTRRSVIVFTRQTRCFEPGDVVSVLFNGVITQSIPPQITAIAVRRLSPGRRC